MYISMIIPHGSSISFNFNFSDTSTFYQNIKLQQDALYYENNGLISLTQNFNSTGRATYNQPVFLWDKNSGEVTNFTTQFSFNITYKSQYLGDGFAFFLSPYPSQIPPNSDGGDLGLFNATTRLNASMNQIVAVEFDTFWNAIDPNSTGVGPCHIGIDVDTRISTSYRFIENCSFVQKNKQKAEMQNLRFSIQMSILVVIIQRFSL